MRGDEPALERSDDRLGLVVPIETHQSRLGASSSGAARLRRISGCSLGCLAYKLILLVGRGLACSVIPRRPAEASLHSPIGKIICSGRGGTMRKTGQGCGVIFLFGCSSASANRTPLKQKGVACRFDCFACVPGSCSAAYLLRLQQLGWHSGKTHPIAEPPGRISQLTFARVGNGFRDPRGSASRLSIPR